MADWLEFYAKVMDLNIWTSSEVTKIQRDGEKGQWIVTVIDTKGSTRLLRPQYVILAMGFSVPKVPVFSGTVGVFSRVSKRETGLCFFPQNAFDGQILHSNSFNQATDYPGKKIVVVGACTSGSPKKKQTSRATFG